ncbi:MAG: response regulator [Alphaproteobacteria bacterium]
MKIIDNAVLDSQLEFIASVGGATGPWHALDVGFDGPQEGTIVSLARKIEKDLAGHEGAILLEGPHRLTVLAAVGADAIAAACGGAPVAAAPDVLEATKDRLVKAARGKAAGRSTLYRHRAERQGNVMMVADDDVLVCAVMKNALSRFGECVVAMDAASVLDLYLKTSPDCVFMDLHLGDGSGLAEIEGIMAHDKDAYIIMLTSDSKASTAVAAKSCGAKSFVAKPIVPERVEYELFRAPTFRRYGS